MMDPGLVALVVLALFLVMLLLRVPIAFALLLACLPFFLIDPRMDEGLLAQQVYAGIDSFVLLAVPFFILAAAIMNASQVTERLIVLAQALIGWVRGGLGITWPPPWASAASPAPRTPTSPAWARS